MKVEVLSMLSQERYVEVMPLLKGPPRTGVPGIPRIEGNP